MRIDFYLRFRTQYGQHFSITALFQSQNDEITEHAIDMRYLNSDFWHTSIETDPDEHRILKYQYIFTNEKNEVIKDAEKQRSIELDKTVPEHLMFIDTWNYAGQHENIFFTAPFRDVIFHNRSKQKIKHHKDFTHLFKVKAPLLQKHETVGLLGNSDLLGSWNTDNILLLKKHDEWYSIQLDLKEEVTPVIYKYGIYDQKKKDFIRFEAGDNRMLHATNLEDSLTIIHDGFIQLANNTWKGAGVAVPVFSLRTNNSFGVGEFNDIKLLVDWSVQTGLKLIQLLPVNDTSASFSNQDSYPYASISAFALHPIYININKVAGKKFDSYLKSVSKKRRQLNELEALDYTTVISFKMRLLKELYDLDQDEFLKDDEYLAFFKDNQYWLKPYAAFCVLRDRYGTSDFKQWKTNSVYNEHEIDKLFLSKSRWVKGIRFYYFVQYHLHLQLKEAVNYAHKHGIALKGDIPIGIYRYGVDAWRNPELYHMQWQAGAPPDDFAVKGQNWGFPTYNWDRMQEDHFEWWKQRFQQISNYFDAFRIDHILGFFRIWSIPVNAVEGVMGRFVPALPVNISEFGERGIWFDFDRFCKPYITNEILDHAFGKDATYIIQTFLTGKENKKFSLKEEFDTQRKIEEYFAIQEHTEENVKFKTGLYDIISNVILFEEPGSNQEQFHFRISIDKTLSFQYLDGHTKHKLQELYIDYFYHRQDEFWKQEALRKLPYLKQATDMLICGEDLGMVPHCVPDVMKNLGILSLEIQRMPKNSNTEFFHPKDAPYLSVITPSTHDMSTIRGWWEENRNKTQKFYNQILEFGGEAPINCASWISRAIIMQHLYSPAMWSIFLLQDLLGMNDLLRRENTDEERINQPADPNHYWKYRMHINLEQLLKENDFNKELKEYIINSRR